MNMPNGYLRTTKFTTPSIKTDAQRNVLEAFELAVSQKFKQFDTMNDITCHLTSDCFWQGEVYEYEKGYYIQLNGTRSSFVAFVAGDMVIRKPRNAGLFLHRYSIEGRNGLVEFMSHAK